MKKTDLNRRDAEAQRFSRDEIMAGIRELYADWYRLKSREAKVSSTRLPDFEAALDQIDREGLRPQSSASAALRALCGEKEKEAGR